MLYVVATPIGNTLDISQRAVEVLSQVDCILAEDTRHSRKLLDQLSITTPCRPLHEHNERQASEAVVDLLKQGQSLALISDAGTPLISDPGFHLVNRVRESGFKVVPIPGASALTTALCVSGLPTDRFCFEGFLPSKSGNRCQKLESIKQDQATLIFYESPHRILASLKDMEAVLGSERQIAVCRELTKKFETIWTGTLAESLEFVASDPNQQRGEFVLVLAGADSESASDGLDVEDQKLLKLLLTELPLKKAASLASKYRNKNKKQFYDYGLTLK